MPKPRIYVETTIPSTYHSSRTDSKMVEWRDATREWWAAAARSSQLVTSEIVLWELQGGKPEEAMLRLELMKPVRKLKSGTAELATALAYANHKVMPLNPLADALHLAIASHHGCDVLLTWNFHHLANANKLDRIRKLNEALGISVPRILSPLHMQEVGS